MVRGDLLTGVLRTRTGRTGATSVVGSQISRRQRLHKCPGKEHADKQCFADPSHLTGLAPTLVIRTCDCGVVKRGFLLRGPTLSWDHLPLAWTEPPAEAKTVRRPDSLLWKRLRASVKSPEATNAFWKAASVTSTDSSGISTANPVASRARRRPSGSSRLNEQAAKATEHPRLKSRGPLKRDLGAKRARTPRAHPRLTPH